MLTTLQRPGPTRKWRGIALYISAFLLPVILLFAAFSAVGIFPAGDKSILLIDSRVQYVAFFSEYRRMLLAGELPIFSRYFGLGLNFIGLFAYYLASPFHLILLLFPRSSLISGIYMVLLMKAGASGLSFYFFSRKTRGLEGPMALVFSTMYALCGFFVSYSDNIQWLDAMVWLPVLILLVERLFFRKRGAAFTLCLAVLIFSNFYISFSAGFFCFLYALYLCLSHGKSAEWGRTKFMARFAVYALLGIGLSACLFLPTIYVLRDGMSLLGQAPDRILTTADPIGTVGKFFVGTYDTLSFVGQPKIYSGLLPLFLVPLYFFSPGIRRRERLAGGVLLLFLFAGLFLEPLDFFWHGMDHPNWYPFRFTYILSFFLCDLAQKSALSENWQDKIARRKVAAVFVFLSGLMAASVFLTDYVNNIYGRGFMVLVNLIFLTGILLALLKSRKQLLWRFLLVLVCAELFFQTFLTISALDSEYIYKDYRTFIDTYRNLSESFPNQDSDSQTYRMEKTGFNLTANDPMLSSYLGFDSYASAGNVELNQVLHKWGYAYYINYCFEISNEGGTPLSNSILGLRGFLLREDRLSPGRFPISALDSLEGILRQDKSNNILPDYTAAVNDLARPIAFPVSPDILNFHVLDSLEESAGPFRIQEDLLGAMTGSDVSCFLPLRLDALSFQNVRSSQEGACTRYEAIDPEDPATVSLTIRGQGLDNPLYLYPDGEQHWSRAEFSLTASGREYDLGHPLKYGEPPVISLGSYPEGELLTITITLDEKPLYLSGPDVCMLDMAILREAFGKLTDQAADFVWVSSNRAVISVSADREGVLFVSIPYDNGWSATVNGEKAEVVKTADAFIGIRIPAGESHVELTFMPDGLLAGTVITGISILLLCGLKIAGRKRTETGG